MNPAESQRENSYQRKFIVFLVVASYLGNVQVLSM